MGSRVPGKQRAGFTLIELLVVIGIIAVLAAIIVPVYSRAQEKARQADCIAHLHAIGIAMRLYHLDEKAYPQPDPAYPLTASLTQGGGLVSLYSSGQLSNAKALWCKDDLVKQDWSLESGSYYMFNAANPGDPPDIRMLYNWFGYDANGYDDKTFSPGLYQLSNPNCMDETIITHCPHHRQFWTEGSQQMDPVIRVGGDADMVRVAAMTSAGAWQNQGTQP